MKILCEDTIPHGEEYFAELGDVKLYSWQTLCPEDLIDVEVLVVRSTTKVDCHLLKQANRLQFVTTATAGTNHIDMPYLTKRGIDNSSAAGCNAVAVAEYVISALIHAALHRMIDWQNVTVGIVGAGNVGTALSERLDVLNIPYKLCDPLKQAAGDNRLFCDLNTVAQCDVVTFHVPYSDSGDYPTRDMINTELLAKMHKTRLLINACRGEVLDQAAWAAYRQAQPRPNLVADVFANEPDIDTDFLEHCWLCTPHIAGHSLEGKLRGTQIAYEQVCDRLKQTPKRQLNAILPPMPVREFTLSSPLRDTLSLEDLSQLFFLAYDIQIDDRHFRQEMAKSNRFAQLRKQYRTRRECSAFTLRFTQEISAGIEGQLCGLGFRYEKKSS